VKEIAMAAVTQTGRKPITVTPDNFCRAETDLYFAGMIRTAASESSFTTANRRPSTTRQSSA
jgi:hypothetical protein